MQYTVADMARAGCTSARGIRFWGDEGLLGEVDRSPGGDRRYTDEQIDKAKIIAAAQFGGFALAEIKEMLLAYDMEVYDALRIRLAQQSRAAAKLAQELPQPPDTKPAVEFDL